MTRLCLWDKHSVRRETEFLAWVGEDAEEVAPDKMLSAGSSPYGVGGPQPPPRG